MRFGTVILKNLLRRPVRTLLTLVGLSIAVTAVVALTGISQGFERSYHELYAKNEADLLVQRAGGAMQLNSVLNESLGDRIRAVPGVRNVNEGLVDVVSFEQYDLYVVIVNGWPAKSVLLGNLDLVSGRRLEANDQHCVMLGEVLAANMGKKVGDTIEMYAETFKVVGIFSSYNVYESGSITILLDELQRLTDRRKQVTGFTVSAEKPASSETIEQLRKQIEGLAPGLSVLPSGEFVRSVMQIRSMQAMSWVISAIALVLGSIGMLNTMAMSVFERAREIGTLRAIGWRKLRVVAMIFCEALLLSTVSAVLGILGALALTHVLSNMPTTAGLIRADLSASVVLQGLVLSMLVGVTGAMYPATWGANLLPVEALHRR